MKTDYQDMKMQEKFWSRVAKGTENDCWPWNGYQCKGFGIFAYKNILYTAHRMAFIFYYGTYSLKSSETILHTCSNLHCCNPKHLYIKPTGTIHINMLTEREKEKLRARFEKYISRKGEDDCWVWNGPRRKSGKLIYGYLRCKNKYYFAQRLAFMFSQNKFDLGYDDRIFSICNNHFCCNSRHLYLLVGIRGENNMSVKLTREQVLEIRSLFLSKKYSKTKLSRKFGVSIPEILYIIRRKVWDWLDP